MACTVDGTDPSGLRTVRSSREKILYSFTLVGGIVLLLLPLLSFFGWLPLIRGSLNLILVGGGLATFSGSLLILLHSRYRPRRFIFEPVKRQIQIAFPSGNLEFDASFFPGAGIRSNTGGRYSVFLRSSPGGFFDVALFRSRRKAEEYSAKLNAFLARAGKKKASFAEKNINKDMHVSIEGNRKIYSWSGRGIFLFSLPAAGMVSGLFVLAIGGVMDSLSDPIIPVLLLGCGLVAFSIYFGYQAWYPFFFRQFLSFSKEKIQFGYERKGKEKLIWERDTDQVKLFLYAYNEVGEFQRLFLISQDEKRMMTLDEPFPPFLKRAPRVPLPASDPGFTLMLQREWNETLREIGV